MMDRRAIMQMVESDPRFNKIADALENEIARTPIVAEDLDEAIKLLEFVLANPDKYEEVLGAAIKDGIIDIGQAPPQFDAVFVISLLAAVYTLQDRLQQRGYARGGLTVAGRRLASQGRGGDSMLAHINPREAAILQAMGGSGTVNPNTGLREYKGLGSIFKAIVPIALSVIAPGVGTAIGTALGAGATWAPIVGGAVMGAAGSALTGGNPLQGAVMGGLGGGLGGAVGQTVAPSMGQAAQNAIGTGLVGAVSNLAQGKNPLVGGITGAVGGYAGAGGFNLPSNVAFGLKNAGQAMASGADATSSALTGLASSMLSAPRTGAPAPIEDKSIGSVADEVVGGLSAARPSTVPGGGSTANTGSQASGIPGAQSGVAPDTKGIFGNIDVNSALKNVGLMAAAHSLLSAPPDVKSAIDTLSPEQREYFNRPSIQWDWNRLQKDANDANMNLDRYIAFNWPRITAGQYNSEPVAKAAGGALTRLARGAGSGRADTIDARLSDGEYVIDAETVALLGDGSTDEGARRLDSMREQIRRHKGKTLAKGKFSPDAKSPLAYLQGAA